MELKGPPNAVPGQGVKSVGYIQSYSNHYPALLHDRLHQATDAQNSVHCTPGPAEPELSFMQVGSYLFQMPDESARYDSLQQLGLLIQQTNGPIARWGVRRLVLLAEKDQTGLSPH